MMAFDECAPFPCSESRWPGTPWKGTHRGLQAARGVAEGDTKQALFGGRVSPGAERKRPENRRS